MTYQETYRVVHDFIVGATGLAATEVRPVYGNAPAKPSQDRGMLCSINLVNQTAIGQDSRFLADQTGADYTVSGAGSESANGAYTKNGLSDGKPLYISSQASTIKWAAVSSRWELLCSEGLYTNTSSTAFPPLTGWLVDEDNTTAASEPPPSLTSDFDIEETVYGDRNITASIKTYGADSQDTIEKIVLYLSAYEGISLLNKGKLGYLRHGPVSDISSLMNGNYENRRHLNIEFHVVTEATHVVNAIKSAEIGFKFYGEEPEPITIEVQL